MRATRRLWEWGGEMLFLIVVYDKPSFWDMHFPALTLEDDAHKASRWSAAARRF